MAIPVVQPLTLSGNEDTEILATLVGSDPDLDPLDFYEIVTAPTNGIVVPVQDGGIEEYVYKPGANFNGTDSFTYRVFANGEYSAPVTVDITVNSVADMPKIHQNLAPVASTQSGLLGGGNQVDVAATTVDGSRAEVRHGFNQLGDTEGIYIQIFDAGGTPTGTYRVNTTTADVQIDPSVTRLGNGDYVVTWTSLNQDSQGAGVFMQRIAPNGTLLGGEMQVNSTGTGDQHSADVTAMNDGGWLVVWESFNGAESHVYAQRYDNAGTTVGGEQQIDTIATYEAVEASVATMGNGSYVISWTAPGGADGDDAGVFAAVYDNQGNPSGSAFQVNTTTIGTQSHSQVAILANGELAFAFTTGSPGVATGIGIARYTPSGSPIGNEILFPLNGGEVQGLSITGLPDGGFAVGWERYDPISMESTVWLQRYDSAGIALSPPVQVDAASTEGQTAPVLTQSGNDLLVVYSEDPVAAGDNQVRDHVFTLPSKVNVITEGSQTGPYQILPQVVINDPDTTHLTSVTVQIAGGYRDGDKLDVGVGESGLTKNFSGNTLTLSGSGTLAAYSNVLQTLGILAVDGGGGNRTLDIIANTADGSSLAEQLILTVNTANQNLGGASNADTLRGGNGMDTLSGNAGNDWMTGNDNHDSMLGGSGFDFLWGGWGDDTLNGGFDNDTMEGYLGNDTYIVNASGDVINEGAGDGFDTVYSSADYTLDNHVEVLVLAGGSNINATGNTTDNDLRGNYGNNSLFGGAGNDTLNGGAGDDILTGDAGNDTLIGGTGNDIYYTDTGDTVIETWSGGTDVLVFDGTKAIPLYVEDLYLGGTGNWIGYGNVLDNDIYGNDGNNLLSGGVGNDYLYGSVGTDTLVGGSGDDTLGGGAGNDLFRVDSDYDVVNELGGGGIDTVHATATTVILSANVEHLFFFGEATFYGEGNNLANRISGDILEDTLYGLDGSDTLSGGTGGDFMYGDNGWDKVYGGHGNDFLFGGNGNDYLLGGLHNDTLEGENGIDTLLGDAGNDTLGGGFGNDNLQGGINDDTLFGDDDNDTLIGGDGMDVLYGGTGLDSLVGGLGADSFVFDTPPDDVTNLDSVDFESGVDNIQIDAAIFDSLVTGVLSPSQFLVGTAAADVDDYLIFDDTSGALYYDADGSLGGAQVQFAQFTGTWTLLSTDFYVYNSLA